MLTNLPLLKNLRQEKGDWDNDNGNTANVFLSNANGSFDQQTLSEDLNIKGDLSKLLIEDFDGDGKADFLRQGHGDNTGKISFA